MRAWRFYALGDMRLDELPDPEPGPGEALLRTRVVQPSVTEAILAAGRETLGADLVREKLRSPPASLFGHEYCAEVIAVGPGVERVRPGDRVADVSVLPCLACALCREGRPDECRRGPHVGWDLPGCLSDYAVLPELGLVPLPDGVSDYEAACLQPAADCVAAVESARLEAGETVAILGQGTMGACSLQIARERGARAIAIDVRPEPLARARELGADACVDASTGDPVESVRELTGGRGADVVLECAGGPPGQGLAGSAGLEQAFELVRDCGRVVVESLVPGSTAVDLIRWRLKSVDLVFPLLGAPRHLLAAADLVATGKLRLDPLISHAVWGLEGAPEAFEITANKGRYGATGPCQIVVDTERVPRHPRLFG